MKKLLLVFLVFIPTITFAGNNNYDALLREAVGRCDLDGISYSLNKGAKIDSTVIGEIFSKSMRVNDCTATFEALLGGGLDPNVRLKDGSTPSIKLFTNIMVEGNIVRIFEKAGARVTDNVIKVKSGQWGRPGWTPLMIIVNDSGSEVDRSIDNPGAYLAETIRGNWNWVLVHSKMNSQNFDGNTALHLAAERGYEAIIKSLLEAGADKGIKNRAGETAADIAVRSGYSKLLAYLN